MLQLFYRHTLALKGLAVSAFSSSSRLESEHLNQRKADFDKPQASLQIVARAVFHQWMIHNRAFASLLPKFELL